MKSKRILSAVLVVVLMLTFVSTAFAATSSYDATQIYRAYAFGPYAKLSGSNSVTVTCNTLIFTSGTKTYHLARPQSSSGTLFSSSKKVYVGAPTSFTLNNTGTNATVFYLKVYNPYYSENGDDSVKMEVHGSIVH